MSFNVFLHLPCAMPHTCDCVWCTLFHRCSAHLQCDVTIFGMHRVICMREDYACTSVIRVLSMIRHML